MNKVNNNHDHRIIIIPSNNNHTIIYYEVSEQESDGKGFSEEGFYRCLQLAHC